MLFILRQEQLIIKCQEQELMFDAHKLNFHE